MQSVRLISRTLPKTLPITKLLTTPTRKMSFFPRGFISEPTTTGFAPLFRLLEDFDQYSSSGPHRHHHRGPAVKTFSPKFDVKELADSYELYGELPGIEQKDIEIEFSDNSTLTIRGRTERSYTSGTPPAGFIESATTTGSITAGDESTAHKEHKATVEDEGADATSTEVANTETNTAAPTEPKAKYWVSERSVGEFSRSFSFPERVDTEAVRASMKNGILSIVVPKSRKQEKRRITIE